MRALIKPWCSPCVAIMEFTLTMLRCPVTALGDSILGDVCDPLDFAACPSGPGSPVVCDPVTQRCAESCRFDSNCATYDDALCAIEEGADTGVCRRSGC